MATELTTFEHVKKGERFKVLRAANGHNYPLNTSLTFCRNGKVGVHIQTFTDCAEEVKGNSLPIKAGIVLINESLHSLKKDYINLIRESEEKLAEMKRKIDFCETHNLEEYDPDLEKVYSALSVMKSRKTDIEKAKAIIHIIK